ncbi:hypothetical protein Baya_16931 [Bagarius yarrelli]|uniref:Uncharacterized protein n=1 Tax=Bagarius yarrelli TaxID=175774 RepID=A0A556VX23_BAGYA|nr:hypothetical protein Baya_16931 [Bagarius yarrelli]
MFSLMISESVVMVTASLPAKSEEEAQRHRQQYNEMISVAKRRGEEEPHPLTHI